MIPARPSIYVEGTASREERALASERVLEAAVVLSGRDAEDITVMAYPSTWGTRFEAYWD